MARNLFLIVAIFSFATWLGMPFAAAEAPAQRQQAHFQEKVIHGDPTKKDLNDDDIEKASYVVDHHHMEKETYKLGATRVDTIDKDEDPIHYWRLNIEQATPAFADIDGDGKGDAVLFLQLDDDYHLVALLNKNGVPTQTCDLLIRSKEINPDRVKFESGLVVAKWFDYTKNVNRFAKFKVVDGKLVLVEPLQNATIKDNWTLEYLSLSRNPRDLRDFKEPKRIPKMIDTGLLKTGVKTTKLNKPTIKKALEKMKKQMGLVDEYSGMGQIQSITYGDLNADGVTDAAIVFAIGRADNDQLLLIPVLLDRGQVSFVGRVGIGAGGFDTAGTVVKIKQGIIHCAVETFDKTSVQVDKHPWASMRFKIHKGNKLIKLK